jgi:gluconokinase
MLTAASRPRFKQPRLFVLMGVAGCGKSTIGEALALALGASYLDGDRFHPEANITKMTRGEPLADEDRWPWLSRIGLEIASRKGIVLCGCSALKRIYRDTICNAAGEPVQFIHLAGSRELIEQRMAARTGHFMPVSLLDSQFATLEPPAPDEDAISVDIDAPTAEIVAQIACQIGKDTK